MVGQNQTFAEDASINKPPLFTGENYPFWKVRKQIFLESVDRGIWDAILSGPFMFLMLLMMCRNQNPLNNGLHMKIDSLNTMLRLEINIICTNS